MSKIPAPKKIGNCVKVFGLTVCPHTVYLTSTQKKSVHAMHRENIAKVKKLASKKTAKTAKAKSRKAVA
jgi:hypothetical protein